MSAYTFSDVLIKPKYSEVLSRKNVNIETQLFEEIFQPIPIVAANMKTICGPKMAAEMALLGGFGILHRFNTIDEAVKDYYETRDIISESVFNFENDGHLYGVSIGVHDTDKERMDKLYEAGAKVVAIDVAHGHHILVKNMIKWIREQYKDNVYIIAGNIATAEAALDMADWGADVVKVGIGPGAVCTTRQRTGVGIPQLYALENVAEAIDANNIPLKTIADGGIVNIGDIPKALKFVDAVMVGSIIAGTSETPGHAFRDANNQYYKVYGGSASGENKGSNQFVEGMMKTIPFRGKVKFVLREIEDGIRSAFSYVGANTLHQFRQKCEFQFVSGNSAKESKI